MALIDVPHRVLTVYVLITTEGMCDCCILGSNDSFFIQGPVVVSVVVMTDVNYTTVVSTK